MTGAVTPTHIGPWLRMVAAHACEGLLTPAQTGVLHVVASFADYETGGGAYPGRRHIATVGGFSPKTITRALGRGVELGLLEPTGTKRRKGGDLTVYRLTAPSEPPAAVAVRVGAASPADIYDTTNPVPLKTEPGSAGDTPGTRFPFGPNPVPFRPQPGSPLEGTRPPNLEQVVVVGVADADSASASPAAPLNDETARAWLNNLSRHMAAPYNRLGATALTQLLGHADKLQHAGWPPAAVARMLTGLPAVNRITSSPDALVAARLAMIPATVRFPDTSSAAAAIAAAIHHRDDQRITWPDDQPTLGDRVARQLADELGVTLRPVDAHDDPSTALASQLAGSPLGRLSEIWNRLPAIVADVAATEPDPTEGADRPTIAEHIARAIYTDDRISWPNDIARNLATIHVLERCGDDTDTASMLAAQVASAANPIEQLTWLLVSADIDTLRAAFHELPGFADELAPTGMPVSEM